jgi:hypothetical protein
MNSFQITLKNERVHSYRRVAVSIFVLHFLFFIYYLTRVGINAAVLTGVVASAFAAGMHFIVTKKKSLVKFPASIIFFLLAIVWLMLANYWLAIALVLLAMIDMVSMKKQVMIFSEPRIEFPSFPKKQFSWDELTNVILKDRILTLDFKNGRLLQAEIAAESYDTDEKLFNGFCTQQLQKQG